MNKRQVILASAVAAALLVGCHHQKQKHPTTDMSDSSGGSAMMAANKKIAVAHIMPAQSTATRPAWGKPTGDIVFTQMDGKVHVTGTITGLPPGKHGIHIHEKGDLSAPDLMSTGGHYNPEHHMHGGPTTSPVHAGDLGNITADSSGKAMMDLTVDDITIGGDKNDILGHAVIIHAKEDDLKSQPAGAAGARIAGGVIQMQK
jgi:Cu-Zn family superoxide dismutase